jgi:gas vesicle protein
MNDRTYYSRDAEMRANQERMGTTLLFIVLGLGIGAVLALLFAPSSGEKVRHEISGAIEDRFGRRDAGLNLHKLEKEFSDLRKKVEDRLAEMR